MSNITIRISVKENRPPLWRVKHWKEARHPIPSARPEMWPFFPNHFSPFDEAGQRLSRRMNPLLTDSKWTNVYGGYLWIANQQGFNLGRRNYITGANPKGELPKVEALTCGGNVVTGYPLGNNLVVDMLDWRNLPTFEQVMLQPWHITVARWVYSDGTLGYFPQGEQPGYR